MCSHENHKPKTNLLNMTTHASQFVVRSNETVFDFLKRYRLENAVAKLNKFGFNKWETFNIPSQHIIDSIRPNSNIAETVRILCQMCREQRDIKDHKQIGNTGIFFFVQRHQFFKKITTYIEQVVLTLPSHL